MVERLKSYRYKNLTYLFGSFLLAFILLKNQAFNNSLLHLSKIGYFGAFIGGMLFASSLTAASGTIILLILAKTLSPIKIGIVASLGAVIGDFTVFRFIRSRSIIHEIKDVLRFFRKSELNPVFKTKYFSWILSLVGALIIASPLPDEIGVGLIGISKIKNYQFILLSFSMHSIGFWLMMLAFISL